MHSLDKMLYLQRTNSGTGIRETAEFIRSQTKHGEVHVIVPSTLGNPIDGVLVYLWNQPNIRWVYQPGWPAEPRLIAEAPTVPAFESRWARQPSGTATPSEWKRMYLVYPFTQYPVREFLKFNPQFSKVRSYPKPDPRFAVDVYATESPEG